MFLVWLHYNQPSGRVICDSSTQSHTSFCVSYDIPLERWALIDLFLLLGSVQFSCSVVSDSLRPHGLQHSRPPCPSPTPGAYSNLCCLSLWCHPTISSSVIPFSSCLQSFPASGSFQMTQFLHQVSFSISPSNEYSGLISFRMDWFDFLAVQGTLKSLLQHHSSKALCLAFFMVQLSYPYMTTGKTIALTRWTFVGKVMSLLLNMLSEKDTNEQLH